MCSGNMMMTSSHTTPRYRRSVNHQLVYHSTLTYLCVIHVMHFIEDHKLDVANQVGATIKHASQDLGRHL